MTMRFSSKQQSKFY